MTIQLKHVAANQSTCSRTVSLADDLAKVLSGIQRLPMIDAGEAIEHLEKLPGLLVEAHAILFKLAREYQLHARQGE